MSSARNRHGRTARSRPGPSATHRAAARRPAADPAWRPARPASPSPATAARRYPPPTVSEALLLLVASTLVGSGVIHVAVVGEHLREWVAAGVFFLLLGVAQLGAAAAVLVQRSRLALAVAGTSSAALVLLWTASRTVGLPFGPGAGTPEAVGSLDVLAVLLETASLVGVGALLSGRSDQLGRRLGRAAPVAALLAAVPLVLPLLVLPGGYGGHPHPAQEVAPASASAAPAGPDPAGTGPTLHGAMPGMPGMDGAHSMPGAAGQSDDADDSDMHAGTDTLGLDDAALPVANLGVSDQTGDGRSLTVGDAEVNGSPGWVVVQRERDGRPGAVLGRTRRLNGQHGAPAVVRFAHRVPSGTYWVSLHRDLGRQRVYEPGPDVVAIGAGAPLQQRVTLTVR